MSNYRRIAETTRSGAGRIAATLAVGLTLLLPTIAEAQTIVHTDPTDIHLFVDLNSEFNPGYELDLNGDTDIDFHFNAERSHTTFAPRFSTHHLARFVRDPLEAPGTGGRGYVAALEANTAIGPTSSWEGATGVIRYALMSDGTELGVWPENVDRFVGLEFRIGANTHYGWVRLTADASATHASLTLKDWAYNATPGEAILAGQTSEASAVPEPSAFALFGVGATAVLGLIPPWRPKAA